MHQEENAGRPTFQKVDIPGADIAITASFAETRVGLARPAPAPADHRGFGRRDRRCVGRHPSELAAGGSRR
jgi:hypothetical protein